VLPPGFEYFEKADLFTPLGLALAPDSPFTGRNNRAFDFYAVARLKPGVTLAQADSEMKSLGQQLAQEYPNINEGRGAQAERLQDVMSEGVRVYPCHLWLNNLAVTIVVCEVFSY
jgi:putative ABC transport system permease protein